MPSMAQLLGRSDQLSSTSATIMCMEERDAIEELRAATATRDAAATRLKAAVRRADQQGYPRAHIARIVGVHRNTIKTWCDEEKDQ